MKGSIKSTTLVAKLYKQEGNYSEAIKLLKTTLNSKNPEAIYEMGLSYYNGHGVVKDYKKSKEYFQEAADMGHYNSQKMLKKMDSFLWKLIHKI